jgi:hypothetical protein
MAALRCEPGTGTPDVVLIEDDAAGSTPAQAPASAGPPVFFGAIQIAEIATQTEQKAPATTVDR